MDNLKIYRAIKSIKSGNYEQAGRELKEVLLRKVAKKVNKLEESVRFQLNVPCLGYRSLSEIAKEIEENWRNIPENVVPYIKAMKNLRTITESYYAEDGKNIVSQFLANSAKWKGAVASRVKTELKAMLVGIPVSEMNESCSMKNEEAGGSCSLPNRGKEKIKPQKPEKVNGKYLLKDQNLNYDEESVIVDTDNPKEVAVALRNKWAIKLEDAENNQFGVRVVYKGKPYQVNYLGKLGGRYRVNIGAMRFIEPDVTSLYNKVVKHITGQAPQMEAVEPSPAQITRKKPMKVNNISYTDFVTEWVAQKELRFGDRPESEVDNYEVAYESDITSGFLQNLYENKQLREKILTEHLSL